MTTTQKNSECKHYKHPISRDIIQKVYDNLRAVGVQKGIVISTSNFQSGAIEYAQIHGIALIQITDAGNDYFVRGEMNIIRNHSFVPSNGDCPYIGVLQRKNMKYGGINCSYLTYKKKDLKEFLLNR